VFCNTKAACADLAAYLQGQGFTALALHGDVDQRDRDDVLTQFTNQSCNILVATDVAARGLDIPELSMVINAELPRDAEVYVHRIGRTGRMHAKGLALSLCAPDERFVAARIEKYLARTLSWNPLHKLKAPTSRPDSPDGHATGVEGKKGQDARRRSAWRAHGRRRAVARTRGQDHRPPTRCRTWH